MTGTFYWSVRIHTMMFDIVQNQSFLLMLPSPLYPLAYLPMLYRVDSGWMAGAWRVIRRGIKNASIYYCETRDRDE